ncbi:MAG: class II aldolase/adducin family protein [Thermoprotei archaeon]|nr:MAG: class II aldolase/adducin family protein [Thermoprotei archaeon]
MNDILTEPYILIDAMKFLVVKRLTNPRGGNGSIRKGSLVWLTPSGIPKHMLRVNDLVIYDLDRNLYMGLRKPSIEINAHIMIYKKIDHAKVVLHAHPPISTALVDVAGIDWLDEVFAEIKYSVGRVSICKPAPPGTIDLANNILEEVLKGSRLVVIPRHGVISWGEDIGIALDAIVAFEDAAKYYLVKRIMK